MRLPRFWILLAMGSSAACAEGSGSGPIDRAAADVERAVASINESDYLSRLGVIAHDSMGGRDTPSPGLDMTAAWIASELASFGITPGGADGSYLQRYPLRRTAVDFRGSSVRTGDGAELAFGRDVAPTRSVPEGDRVGGVTVLFGSEGWRSGIELAGLAGRHVVLVGGDARAGAADRRVRRLGRFLRDLAPASVLVPTTMNDEAWSESVEDGKRLRLGAPWNAPRPPTLEVREEALSAILAEHGFSLSEARDQSEGAFKSVEIDGLEVTLTGALQVIEEFTAPNVIGILEGSDAQLKDEYVVLSAHMDHIGIGRPDASGDSINNGADDDASGTVAVLEVAEALAMLTPAPRRSVLFILVSGEEKGLLGSRYFSESPTVPLERMVADLNVDMVGRNWTDTIVGIGKEHSDLGQTLDSVNAAHPELNMTAIDDIWPEESFYTRSDHYHFARKGVPILFFFNGTHEDYHRPSDEVAKIDGDKASRIARLLFYLGLELADRDVRPQWDPESYRRIVENQ